MSQLPMKRGEFTLLRKIGEGGMAEVFLAEREGDEDFKTLVALKRLHGGFALDQYFIRQLVQEAKLLAQLQHNHIVRVHDLRRIEDEYYIVMEYIDGIDLAQAIQVHRDHGLRFPLSIYFHVALALCEALDFAHGATDHGGRPIRLIHRDIKPSNVLISARGVVKLTDFGIARVGDTSNTGSVVKGTANYMSPEQASGEQNLSAASDIFSLGAVFWEMLTLEKLVDGSNYLNVINSIKDLNVGLKDITKKGIEPGLRMILLRMLARKRELRYQSMGLVLKDLRFVAEQMKVDLSPSHLRDYMGKIIDFAHEAARRTARDRNIATSRPAAGEEDPPTDPGKPRRVSAPAAPQALRAPAPVAPPAGPEVEFAESVAALKALVQAGPRGPDGETSQIAPAPPRPAPSPPVARPLGSATAPVSPSSAVAAAQPAPPPADRPAPAVPAAAAAQPEPPPSARPAPAPPPAPRAAPPVGKAKSGKGIRMKGPPAPDLGAATPPHGVPAIPAADSSDPAAPPSAAGLRPMPAIAEAAQPVPGERPRGKPLVSVKPGPPSRSMSSAPTSPQVTPASPSPASVATQVPTARGGAAAPAQAGSFAPPATPGAQPAFVPPPPPTRSMQNSGPTAAPEPAEAYDEDDDYDDEDDGVDPRLLWAAVGVVVLLAVAVSFLWLSPADPKRKETVERTEPPTAEPTEVAAREPTPATEPTGEAPPASVAEASPDVTPEPTPMRAEPVEVATRPEPRGTPARSEPVRMEPARTEGRTTTRTEPARTEPRASPRSEPVRTEARSEPVRTEARSEPVRTEARSEPVRSEPARTEPARTETAPARTGDLRSPYDEPTPAPVAWDTLADAARRGKLTAEDSAKLAQVGATAADYKQARALLMSDAEARGDMRAHCQLATDALRSAQLAADPQFNLEASKCHLREGRYQDALSTARNAELHAQDIPARSRTDRQLKIWEVEAKAYKGLYQSTENTDFLANAIAVWKRYRQVAENTYRHREASAADEAIRSLEELSEGAL